MSYSAQGGQDEFDEHGDRLEEFAQIDTPVDADMEDCVSSIAESTGSSQPTVAQQQLQLQPSSGSASSVATAFGDSQGDLADDASLVQATEGILGVDWELHQEIFQDMQRCEKKHRTYNEQAKYLKHRRIIVDWMCEVGEEYKLSSLTIHCAVRFLDRLLGSMDVMKNRLQLVAMACILIAAKFEEAEEVVPTLAELNECSNNAYSVDGVKDMEISVLRALNWSLSSVTPIHFLSLYSARGIVFEGDCFEGGAASRKSALKYVKKYADFFAELCLQEYSFQAYLPSVMAGAVIAAARRAVKIDPIWNAELEGLTTYAEPAIYKAYKHLYNYYTESFPTAPHVSPSPKSVQQFERAGAMEQA